MVSISYDDFKVKFDNIEYISRMTLSLKDYRAELEHFYRVPTKIKCRVFYEHDDLPKDLWETLAPEDHFESNRWIAHLLSEEHTARVGVYEVIDDDDISDLNGEPRYSLYFEDPHDLLRFKLTVPR